MDRYQFPHITHISQCLSAIEGCDAFHVAERDRHTIINYHQMGNDTFPPVTKDLSECWFGGHRPYHAAIRRECRGIVFGPDGRVIARRLHKFFNAGEREEVAFDKIKLNVDYNVLQKLDGSMITPIPIGDHIRWGTKMGLTEVGFQVEEFVANRPDYLTFAEYCVAIGITPIFEWCSRKQRIVVDYPEDQLTLIAVRNNITGEYVPYFHMRTFAKFWKMPVVEAFRWAEPTIEGFINTMKLIPEGNAEGYVIRFDDGHSVKLKYEDYVRIHRAKDSIVQEKRVIEMILNEKVDDVLPHLIDHDKKALSSFQSDFWTGFLKTKEQIFELYSREYEASGREKKQFAWRSETWEPGLRSVVFSVWGTPVCDVLDTLIFEELKKRVSNNLGSATRVDSARWIWGGLHWKSYIGSEEV